MKYSLRKTILSSLVVITLITGIAAPHIALAFPAVYVAAIGDPCELPDGSLGGLITSDGQTCCPKAVVNQSNGSADPTQCLYAKYINPAINLLAAAVGVIVIVAIVYGAIEYITSGGDAQRVAAGKKRIIEALIGLVAFILLYTFLQFLIPGGLGNG